MCAHKHSADDPRNYLGSPLPSKAQRARLFSIAALNPGGLNLKNFETKLPFGSDPEALPLHRFEQVIDTMCVQNYNALALSHISAPPKFQGWFNLHRKRFTSTFNTNPANHFASTAIISGKHHGAICGTHTKLEGRLTIHTFTTGKRRRPHGFRRISLFAIYAPQRSKPNPDDPASLDDRETFLNAVAKDVNRLRSLGHIVIVAGDFNLAPEPTKLDRVNGKPSGEEERIFASFIHKTQTVDAFRQLHPHLRAYSHFSEAHPDSASRIDHILIDRKIIKLLRGARIAKHPSFNKATELDHRMVIVDLHLDGLFGALSDDLITPPPKRSKLFGHMQTQNMTPALLEKIQVGTLLSDSKFAKLERQWEEYNSRPPDDPEFILRMEED